MIKSVKIVGGVLKDLGKFPEKIVFSEGVNIIFSPNGSGKSIFLKSLSHRFPTTYPTPLNYPGMGQYDWNDYISKDINQLEVDYDGGIVHYFDNFSIQDSHGNFQKAQYGEGDFSEAIQTILQKPSSGQKIIKFVDSLADLPTRVQFPKRHGNDAWERAQQNFIEFYKQFPSDSRPTILLDELDASLDPDHGLMFLDSVLATLSQEFQVICVTHNPLVLLMDWYTIHNFYQDSSKELLYKMNWLFDKYKNSHHSK